jgi:tetratricopeptide (TPR) repeat protein
MHLDAEAALALLAVREPLAHLLDCPNCRRRLRELLAEDDLPDPKLAALAQTILSRAASQVARDEVRLAAETTRAAVLFDGLLRLPFEHQADAVDDAEFSSPGFAQHLILKAEEEVEDPGRIFHFANLSLTLLERMPPGPDILRLRARALCLVATAQRRRGQADVAADTLHHTAELLDVEPLTAQPRALFCTTLAAVRADQHRVDEALALLERACAIAESNGEWLELAKARLAEGWLLLDELDPDEALLALRECVALIDAAAQPELAFSAFHALALTHATLGRREDLEENLASLGKLRQYLPDRIHALRHRWIHAQALWQLGEARTAITRLRRVFSGLIEEDRPLEAAMVALELSSWALESPPQKTRMLAELLDALEPAAADQRLPPWIWSVVSFTLRFAQALRGAFLTLILSALRYVQHAQFNSYLVFYPLPDPESIVDWSDLSIAARQETEAAAGLNLAGRCPESPEERQLFAWAHETLTGARVRFFGLDPEEPLLIH